MLLEPGLTFRVAARFHCRAAWAERLHVNGGVIRRGAIMVPRNDWRTPAAEELRLLIAEEQPPDPAHAYLELLAIPAALRQRWWEIAEYDAASAAIPGYDAFIGDVLALLRFKRLPVPDPCAADVIVSRPQQSSTRLDRDGRALAGFGFGSLAATRAADRCRTPIAVINLGDEAAGVVVLNLGSDALRGRVAASAAPAAAEQGIDAFFACQPTYPLVQVRLEPGEGLWFPAPPPAFDGWTHGKTDLDAVLILHG